MKENPLIDKSLSFASGIIKLHQYLIKTQKETIISKQIVRSGTSIGANINEANYGQSKADFISKMHIALKETAETEYWLKLLTISDFITEDIAVIGITGQMHGIVYTDCNGMAISPLYTWQDGRGNLPYGDTTYEAGGQNIPAI